jgi:hypothetical protein
VREEEELTFTRYLYIRIRSQDLLLLGFGFKWDLGEESYIERIFIFIIYLKVIYISSYIGDILVVNIKALEFTSVLVSYIGFIIEVINSKALYNYYTKFLSIK